MVRAAGNVLDTLEKRHWYGVHTSSRLTTHFRQTKATDGHRRNSRARDRGPEYGGSECVLMGTHALNTWRDEPRATQDVDVLVRKRDVRKAVQAIRATYPNLVIRDYPVVTTALSIRPLTRLSLT